MNNDLSGFRWGNIPTREIDQNIRWLNQVKFDCEYKIDELKRIKRDRERSKQWRNNILSMAHEFKDSVHLPERKKIQIIMQRFDVDEHKAIQIANRAEKLAHRDEIKERNNDIVRQRKDGVSVATIAEKYNLSRQGVYDVLSKTQK